jgi:trans-2,3-dihydro-3-hydroxyanthranilate isomerase
MPHRFLLIDVFTERAFGGNQLAVFPEAEKIPTNQLQVIATELGLSDTVFLYDSEKDGACRKLRIFTPEAEVPFAGHPIVGASFVLAEIGALDREPEICLELECGEIPVRLHWSDDGQLLQATMTQPRPMFLAQHSRVEMVARALGLESKQILITGLPCEVVSTGLPFLIVPVGSLRSISQITPRSHRLKELGDEIGVSDVYAFTFETERRVSTVHARMFAPSYGIPEDAATGSAAGCLGAYLVRNRAVLPSRLTRITIEQGIEIGRPSSIEVEVESDGERINTVRVGGGAVIVGEGTLRI